MNLIAYFESGFTYEDYLKKIEDQLFDLEKSGDERGYAKYYSINIKRIKRLDEHFELSAEQKEKLRSVENDFQLLVISEGWCGDAAQVVPVVYKMMVEIGVELRLVFRDANEELMKNYLTNGTKSIPILIGIDAEGTEKFRFGPRPQQGMEMLQKHKENPEIYTDEEFHKDLQIWYNQDKGKAIFEEFLQVLS